MEQTKIPDIKLKVGSIMSIVINSIGIFWALLYLILVFEIESIYNSTFNEVLPSDQITLTTMKIVIFLASVFTIVINSLILSFSVKVLKGKAKNGLVPGILLIVFSSLGIIFNVFNFNLFLIPGLLIEGVSLATGILLVIGKYIENTKPAMTNQTSISSDSIVTNNDNKVEKTQ